MDVLSAPRRGTALGRPLWQLGLAVWFVGQMLMLLASGLPLAPGAVVGLALLGFAMWVAGLSICAWRLLVRREGWSTGLAIVLGLLVLAGVAQAVRMLALGPG